MDKKFNVDWFQTFNIVFNALDNIAARRHVNHMCLAANVPLVESGTTGFNGQVQVIEKVSSTCGRKRCYSLELALTDLSRAKRNVTTAMRSPSQNRSPCVRSAATRHSQSIALRGRRAT